LSKSQDEEKRGRAFNIQAAEDAREKLTYRQKSIDIANGVRIWAGKSADPGDIERDFTTPGTPGGLGCPFAGGRLAAPTNGHHRGASTPRSSLSRLSLGRRSRKASFHDPIKAEECVSSPMSKNLNSKYDSMVSMVKGLSAVHSSLLPNTEDIAVEIEDDGEEVVNTSTSKVERWAQAVSASDEGHEEAIASDDDGGRETRFDRSLKDVRVGESPSRPWGIPVPEEFDVNGDEPSKKSDATASPLESEILHKNTQSAPPPMRCPFSGMKAANNADFANSPHAIPEAISDPLEQPSAPTTVPAATSFSTPHIMPTVDPSSQTTTSPTPHMVFNGPVFFGYSFEQAMTVLKQSGLAP
jgi:hypothetical protein